MLDLNTEQKPAALVLGGIFPHAALLEKMRERGYYTVLVDYFDNPPAAAAADEHSTASAMDVDAVLEVARSHNTQLVMSTCLDQQLVVAMRVSEELGLPHPLSSDLALTVTNKRLMKKKMMEGGVPTSRFYSVGSNEDVGNLDLDYPVMVKPANNSGSAGVFKLDSPDGLQDAVAKARRWSRTEEVVVEEFKQGMEISVYAYVSDGHVQVVTTAQRLSEINADRTRCYCTVSPARLEPWMKEGIVSVGDQIAKAFGLDNTPLFYQVIITDAEVFVIEFSPRLGGGLSYRTMQLNTEYDLMDAAIESYSGIKHVGEVKPEKSKYLVHLVYGKDGIFDHLEGYEDLIDEGIIEEVHFMKTKGMEISSEKSSSARTAVMLIEGKTDEILLEKLDEAMTRLEIRDPEGKPLLDRSYWLKKEVLEGSDNASSRA